MKHLKRSLALLLALVLTLSLISGCSKKEPGGDPTPGSQTAEPEDPQKELEKKLKGLEKVKLDHVYSVEYLKTSIEGDTYIEDLKEANGAIYLTASFNRQIPSQQYPGETEYVWGT